LLSLFLGHESVTYVEIRSSFLRALYRTAAMRE
jgi:hypothetical protein